MPRKQRASSIAEAAAAMGIMLPLIFIVIFTVIEITQAYLIRECLAQGARSAARQMAIAYGQDNQIKESRSLQNKLVFDNIRITNIINSSQQFDNPKWNVTGYPPTVTVTVSYTSGKNGLPAFPNTDPLNLASKLTLSAKSVYRVE
jgi:Flp pilus assembly protein TadG